MTKLFRSAILGAPASGKGTISEKIIKKFDVVHISTGDILRKHIVEGTRLGKSVSKYISKGKLVPDVLIMKLALEELKKLEKRNWLLDGFPRTLVQAQKLFMTYPLGLVISLNVSHDILLRRVRGRLVHPGSGRVYNLEFKPPKVPWKDDETGEPLIQRPDDEEEAVLRRLHIYSETQMPLLEFYRKQRILKEFKGSTSDEIWFHLEKELLKYLKPNS